MFKFTAEELDKYTILIRTEEREDADKRVAEARQRANARAVKLVEKQWPIDQSDILVCEDGSAVCIALPGLETLIAAILADDAVTGEDAKEPANV